MTLARRINHDEVWILHKGGYTVDDIARIVACHPTSVTRILAAYEKDPKKAKKAEENMQPLPKTEPNKQQQAQAIIEKMQKMVK